MDTKSLIQEAKARFNHNLAKSYLKDKYESKLIVADQGGLWQASVELISFLHNSKQTEVVILDNYSNPVRVQRELLLTKLENTYNFVMEQWHNEWKQLENKR